MKLPLVGHRIGGRPVDASRPARVGDIYGPATGEVTKQVAMGTAADVDEAVEVAHAAGDEWSSRSLAKRSSAMFAFREQIAARAEEVTAVITSEHGWRVAAQPWDLAFAHRRLTPPPANGKGPK